MTTNALTLRLPPDLYQLGHQIARQRHISLNAFILESLQAMVQQEQQRKLYDDFTLLGEDMEGSDVEYAFAAQRDAVLGEAAGEHR